MAINAKELAKHSRTLHSTVKLLRNMPHGGTAMTTDLSRAADVFRVLPNTMLGIPALMNIYECTRTLECEAIPGSFAECGVWAGGAVGLMALVNRRYGHQPRTLHLFDSFEGLPQPTEEDADVFETYRSQHRDLSEVDNNLTDRLVVTGVCASSAYGKSSLENVTDLFTNVLKLDPRNYVIHKRMVSGDSSRCKP
jgi:hypothetical protein